MGNRRKSVDSSDSGSEYDSGDSGRSGHSGYKHDKSHKKDKRDKDKKDKKDKYKYDHEKKDKKDKDKDKKSKESERHDAHSVSVPHFTPGGGAHPGHHGGFTAGSTAGGSAQEFYDGFDNAASRDAGGPSPFQTAEHHAPVPPHQGHASAIPAPSGQRTGRPPPSGVRIPLGGPNSTIPPEHELGPPPCYEPDGRTPVYLGSALLDSSVQPCKIGFHFSLPARITYGGTEREHNGRFDLLPFVPAQMEFVRSAYGRVPPGRIPVEGGYEAGGKLYHAVAYVDGVRVPGKTGEHLGGCNVGFGGTELVIQDGYEILCWK